MKAQIEVIADKENLQAVQSFLEKHLQAAGGSPKSRMQFMLAAEEIFVNIVSYAYGGRTGTAAVSIDISDDPLTASVTFRDTGTPYDPLQQEDPDTTLPLEERPIGGLGIFLCKKLMDEMTYAFLEGCNVLTLKKRL